MIPGKSNDKKDDTAATVIAAVLFGAVIAAVLALAGSGVYRLCSWIVGS